MSEEIIKVVDDLSARFGIAVDWGSDKALPVLQELFEKLVHYKIMTHSIGIAISVLLITLCVFLIIAMAMDYKSCKNSGKGMFFWDHYGHAYSNDTELSFVGIFSTIAVLITFPLATIACIYNILKLMQLLIVPELYVLTYLMNCVN